MTDTCEHNVIPAALTYEDVNDVSPHSNTTQKGVSNALSALPVAKNVLKKRKL